MILPNHKNIFYRLNTDVLSWSSSATFKAYEIKLRMRSYMELEEDDLISEMFSFFMF